MKKTPREYVYDAINYMRKPASVDIPLQPIADTDNVFKDYGWESHDVCKLCDHIEVDCTKEINHNPFHELEEDLTVGLIVKGIEKQIKDSNFVLDNEFIFGNIKYIEKTINESFADILKVMLAFKGLTQTAGIEIDLNKSEDLLEGFSKEFLPLLQVLEEYPEKISRVQEKELRRTLWNLKEYHNSLSIRIGGRYEE